VRHDAPVCIVSVSLLWGDGDVSEPFNEKLAFVLKALCLSRARLAAQLGVDKSVVGRWTTGAVSPSAHNLARLSLLVATRVPGFTALDWERDVGELNELFRAERGVNGFSLHGGLPLPLLGQMIANTAHRGAAYEGFYRSTRPFASKPGRFVHDHCLVRKDECGLLRLHQTTGGVFVDGWALLMQDHVFVIGVEFTRVAMVFALLHAVEAERVETLDGLVLSPAFDAENTPTTSAIVLERIGDLRCDKVADQERFGELAALDWEAPEGSIPEAMRRHLTRDTGDAQLALGGDWLMRLPRSRSLARGACAA